MAHLGIWILTAVFIYTLIGIPFCWEWLAFIIGGVSLTYAWWRRRQTIGLRRSSDTNPPFHPKVGPVGMLSIGKLSRMFLTQVVAARMPARLLSVFVRNAELLKFLMVGSIAFVATSVVFFGLKWTVLEGKPVTANVVAVLIATVLSYVLNREWAFTARGGRERRHEAVLFFLVAGVGLVINQLPLAVSRYVFALQTPHVSVFAENVADFISATIVGTLLATVFRWWAMRKFVFPSPVVPEREYGAAVQEVQP